MEINYLLPDDTFDELLERVVSYTRKSWETTDHSDKAKSDFTPVIFVAGPEKDGGHTLYPILITDIDRITPEVLHECGRQVMKEGIPAAAVFFTAEALYVETDGDPPEGDLSLRDDAVEALTTTGSTIDGRFNYGASDILRDGKEARLADPVFNYTEGEGSEGILSEFFRGYLESFSSGSRAEC